MPSGSNIVAAPVAGGQLRTGQAVYYGFSLRETTGTTAATVTIYDGTSSAGTVLDSVQLAGGQSVGDFYGPQGIRAVNGIFVVVTGTVVGSVRAG